MDTELQQLTVTLVAVVGIIYWFVFTIKVKNKRLIAVAPLTYFVHIIIFNVARELFTISPADQNLWSNAIRLHSEFLFIMLAFILTNKETSAWI